MPVQHKGWHARNPGAAIALILGQHLMPPGITGVEGGKAFAGHPRRRTQGIEGFGIANIQAILEIGLEDGLGHLALPAIGTGQQDQPMRFQGIGRAHHQIVAKFKPGNAPGIGHAAVQFL